MTKKQSLEMLEKIFLTACPTNTTSEPQVIFDIVGKKNCFEIITKGKTTFWKHTIKTTEI